MKLKVLAELYCFYQGLSSSMKSYFILILTSSDLDSKLQFRNHLLSGVLKMTEKEFSDFYQYWKQLGE